MPEEERESLAADVRAVSTDPAIAERIASIGTIMDIQGPTEFAASVQAQRDRLAGIAKVLGTDGGEMSVRADDAHRRPERN